MVNASWAISNCVNLADHHLVSGAWKCDLIGVPWRDQFQHAHLGVICLKRTCLKEVLNAPSSLTRQGTPMAAHIQLPDRCQRLGQAQ